MPVLPCRCPSCRAVFKIPDNLSAKDARCPHCRAKLRLSSARGQTTVVLLEAGENVRQVETTLRVDAAPATSKTESAATVVTVGKTKNSTRKGGFPLWILAIVIPGALLFCCGGGGMGFLILLSGFQSNPTARAPDETTSNAPNARPGINTAPESVISISAEELYREYRRNEVAAEDKYKGKLLKVSGTVYAIKNDSSGRDYVRLESGEAFQITSVCCYFPAQDKKRLISLKKGQAIVVRGRNDGRVLGDIDLKNCEFLEIKP